MKTTEQRVQSLQKTIHKDKKKKLETRLHELTDQKVEVSILVEQFNKYCHNMKIRGFVCEGCGKLKVFEPCAYLETSNHGYDRPFCNRCCSRCDHCKGLYCEKMKYDHGENCMH